MLITIMTELKKQLKFILLHKQQLPNLFPGIPLPENNSKYLAFIASTTLRFGRVEGSCRFPVGEAEKIGVWVDSLSNPIRIRPGPIF